MSIDRKDLYIYIYIYYIYCIYYLHGPWSKHGPCGVWSSIPERAAVFWVHDQKLTGLTPWSIIPWLIQREGTNFDGYVRHFGVNQAIKTSGANVSCTRRHYIDRCCANILWNGSWDLIDLDSNGDSSNLTKVGFSKQKMRSGLKYQSQTKMFRPKFHRLKEDWSKFSWFPVSQSVNHHSSSIRTWRWCHPGGSRARAKTIPGWRKPDFCCPRDPAKHLEVVRLSWGVFWCFFGPIFQ